MQATTGKATATSPVSGAVVEVVLVEAAGVVDVEAGPRRSEPHAVVTMATRTSVPTAVGQGRNRGRRRLWSGVVEGKLTGRKR